MAEQISRPFTERVLQDMSSAVLVLDTQGSILYVNGPASRMLEVDAGYQEEDIRFSLASENSYNDSMNEAILDALYHKDITEVKKVPYMAPSGKKYVFLMSCSFLREQNEEDSELVITLSDETEAEELRRKFTDSSRTFTAFLFAFWIVHWFFGVSGTLLCLIDH